MNDVKTKQNRLMNLLNEKDQELAVAEANLTNLMQSLQFTEKNQTNKFEGEKNELLSEIERLSLSVENEKFFTLFFFPSKKFVLFRINSTNILKQLSDSESALKDSLNKNLNFINKIFSILNLTENFDNIDFATAIIFNHLTNLIQLKTEFNENKCVRICFQF